MSDKKPYVVKTAVSPQRYYDRHVIQIQLQSTNPEDFMDRVKNSLVEGEVLTDYSIQDASGFSFA